MKKLFLTLKKKNVQSDGTVDLAFETSVLGKFKYEFYINSVTENKAKKFIIGKIYSFKIREIK